MLLFKVSESECEGRDRARFIPVLALCIRCNLNHFVCNTQYRSQSHVSPRAWSLIRKDSHGLCNRTDSAHFDSHYHGMTAHWMLPLTENDSLIDVNS